MTLNHEEATRQNQCLFDEAQQSEILAIIKQDGPCTVAHISRYMGLEPYTVRLHCETLKHQGRVSQNWIRGTYSV